ncbi:MAG: hypothetical protein ACYS1A_17840 [Planctomycetota bacterium]|jgi:hypothetical protein
MSIVAITGPEGAGKTLMLAGYCLMHNQAGGPVYAFPGFEVYDYANGGRDKSKWEKISRDISPIDVAQWLADPPNLDGALIAIDEIQNFFLTYKFDLLAKLFGLFAGQRRKRQVGIAYTMQRVELPPMIFHRTLFFQECWDLYWSHNARKKHKLERGQRILIKTWDRKGFITGREGMPLQNMIFYAKSVWGHYDTHSIVTHMDLFREIEVQKAKYIMDDKGHIVPGGTANTEDDIKQRIEASMELLSGQHLTAYQIANMINAPANKSTAIAIGRVMRGEYGLQKEYIAGGEFGFNIPE